MTLWGAGMTKRVGMTWGMEMTRRVGMKSGARIPKGG